VLHSLLAIPCEMLIVSCAVIENRWVVHQVVRGTTKHYIAVANSDAAIRCVRNSFEAWQLFNSGCDG
jgi:hypothetical protein